MSHLHAERLSALVDEAPTPDESAHLTSCELCRKERAAFTALLEFAKGDAQTMPVIGPPLTQWESLAPALRANGILLSDRSVSRAARAGRRAWLQVAAALLLAAAGMAAGRYSAGAAVLPLTHVSAADGQDTAAVNDAAPSFRTIADAREAQGRSQATYQAAIQFLAQHDTSGRVGDSPASMKARLAALEQVNATMHQALQAAPYDPVITGYYLSAIGQRAATIGQLHAASIRLTNY